MVKKLIINNTRTKCPYKQSNYKKRNGQALINITSIYFYYLIHELVHLFENSLGLQVPEKNLEIFRINKKEIGIFLFFGKHLWNELREGSCLRLLHCIKHLKAELH